MKSASLLLTLMLALITLSGCTQSDEHAMKDGYYTAEAAAFDPYGWKESITIYVSNNRIITCEFNARNPSGLAKSWDMDYMRTMNALCGTYPNIYSRSYSVALVNKQSPTEIDVISGATHSHNNFLLLAQAAINQAKSGIKSVVFVELPEY